MKKQLIKSTSGIRGIVGRGLDPVLVTAYGAAFGSMLKGGKIVVGRDSRPSGEMFSQAVIAGLVSVGANVIDLGVVPTPTVEIAITGLKAVGGICVTASHNPTPWNALKFFNSSGEFITRNQYKSLNRIYDSGRYAFKPVERLGSVKQDKSWIDKHIKKTLAIKGIAKAAITKRKFKVVIDAINSAGSIALPELLEKLGADVIRLNCKGDGNFVHEPEPTPKNLKQLCRAVKKNKADIGLAVDPDADRLALVDENGQAISEELTLTIAIQEALNYQTGPIVINLSTSKVTADIAQASGSRVYYSKVGEANVVEMIHKKKAIIGGEGNGGVIYPQFHSGRDSLVASILVLSALARKKMSLSDLVETFPSYYTIKSKAPLPDDFDLRLDHFRKNCQRVLDRCKIDNRDGLRFDFLNGWVQLRKSNTEPIFRLIVETSDKQKTDDMIRDISRFFK